jgi:hypothetical protein
VLDKEDFYDCLEITSIRQAKMGNAVKSVALISTRFDFPKTEYGPPC